MGPRAGKYNLGPASVNTYWGTEPINTNWEPGPVNTDWEQGPVNENWGPGPGVGARGQLQDRGPIKGPRAGKYKHPTGSLFLSPSVVA